MGPDETKGEVILFKSIFPNGKMASTIGPGIRDDLDLIDSKSLWPGIAHRKSPSSIKSGLIGLPYFAVCSDGRIPDPSKVSSRPSLSSRGT